MSLYCTSSVNCQFSVLYDDIPLPSPCEEVCHPLRVPVPGRRPDAPLEVHLVQRLAVGGAAGLAVTAAHMRAAHI